MKPGQVRALDHHLEGVALEAGFQPREFVLVSARQGSWLWNLVVFNQHGQRLLLLGADGTCTVIAYSLLRTARLRGVIDRDSMYITSRRGKRRIRLRGHLQASRGWSRGVSLQIEEIEHCRRFLDFYDPERDVRP